MDLATFPEIVFFFSHDHPHRGGGPLPTVPAASFTDYQSQIYALSTRYLRLQPPANHPIARNTAPSRRPCMCGDRGPGRVRVGASSTPPPHPAPPATIAPEKWRGFSTQNEGGKQAGDRWRLSVARDVLATGKSGTTPQRPAH